MSRSNILSIEAERATAAIRTFANDRANLPLWVEGRCHDRIAGTVKVIEAARLPRNRDRQKETEIVLYREVRARKASPAPKMRGGNLEDMASHGPARSFVNGNLVFEARWNYEEIRRAGKS